MRLADVLLMAAEAEIEVGSLEKAREYINLVRARAAKPGTWVQGAPATYVIGLYAHHLQIKQLRRRQYVWRENLNWEWKAIASLTWFVGVSLRRKSMHSLLTKNQN